MSGAPWPNLVVIGAMRCGTTSLHAALGRHPDVFASPIKGPGLFLDPDASILYPSKYRSNSQKRGHRTDEALRAAVARGWRGERWQLESTDVYARHPVSGPGVPERMLRADPEMRLVYSLRDPVARIRSQHRFERAKPHRPAGADFGAYLESPADPLGASRYYTQLQRFLAAGFERRQIHVLTLEDLRRDPPGELARLGRFLDLPCPPAWLTAPLPHQNASLGSPSAVDDAELDETLAKTLEPEIRELEAWLGRGLGFPSSAGRADVRAQDNEAYTASVWAVSRPQA